MIAAILDWSVTMLVWAGFALAGLWFAWYVRREVNRERITDKKLSADIAATLREARELNSEERMRFWVNRFEAQDEHMKAIREILEDLKRKATP